MFVLVFVFVLMSVVCSKEALLLFFSGKWVCLDVDTWFQWWGKSAGLVVFLLSGLDSRKQRFERRA